MSSSQNRFTVSIFNLLINFGFTERIFIFIVLYYYCWSFYFQNESIYFNIINIFCFNNLLQFSILRYDYHKCITMKINIVHLSIMLCNILKHTFITHLHNNYFQFKLGTSCLCFVI